MSSSMNISQTKFFQIMKKIKKLKLTIPQKNNRKKIPITKPNVNFVAIIMRGKI